jgi:hypothetical protein
MSRKDPLLQALLQAAKACARRKRHRSDAIAFRVHEGQELLALAERIRMGTYQPEPGRVFVTERPKFREVHVSAYRDRVVHHLLHALLEPLYEPRLSPYSFACRKGKGTHAAARALQEAMWNVTRHGQVRAWALQLDVKSFFPSIHKPTLLAILAPVIDGLPAFSSEPTCLTPKALAERIILHDPARCARRLGPIQRFARVPLHKRLGARGPEHGLPIGNLTSQFFANVYLNPLDGFIQRTLGARAYVRYVDDLVLVHRDREVLEVWEQRLRVFLKERLGLEFHERSKLRPVSDGVDFVGYVIRPTYALPRRRVVEAMGEKLDKLEKSIRTLEVNRVRLHLPGMPVLRGPLRVTLLNGELLEQARATWGSYEGHLGHARAFGLRERMRQRTPRLHALLRCRKGKMTRRFALPRAHRSFGDQRKALLQGLDDAVLLVRVGKYFELTPMWAERLGLRVHKPPCGRVQSGVHVRSCAKLVKRLLREGHRVAVAIEEPQAAGNVKARRLAYLFEAAVPALKLPSPSLPSPLSLVPPHVSVPPLASVTTAWIQLWLPGFDQEPQLCQKEKTT